MKKLIFAIVATLMLSSCARSCQSLERSTFDNHAHNIRLTLYSGGEAVKTWEFNGIVSEAAGSDGYFFYYDNRLVEVSGDVVIEYLD